MNPKNEKLIRHIGFSGHANPPAMIDMIQRDEYGILEGMLVSINANDKTKYNMQHNVIPVAAAKGMGIIAMKVFADAALYHKEPRWSQKPEDVFRKIGNPELPSRPLIEYSLSTPGIHTLIIGIGQIDDDPMKCQLVQNFYAAQIEPNGMPETERKRIEEQATLIKPKSNYFQIDKVGLTAPGNIRKEENKVIWDTAFAGDVSIASYEILVNGAKVGEVAHNPQILKSKPFGFDALLKEGDKVDVVAVDQSGARAAAQLA
jgi:predicted aldo/keto reductase-like oxidoreductase